MDKWHLLQLLNKEEDNTITDEERKELNEWYDSIDFGSPQISLQESGKLKTEMLSQFRNQIAKSQPPFRVRTMNLRMLRAAAVVSGLLLCLLFYYTSVHKSTPVNASNKLIPTNNAQDISPGTNRAVLILGDGSEIDLDKKKPGILVEQGTVQVVKRADGSLDYSSTGQGKIEIMYNIIRTPRGGEYKLVLPDGSQVWLNASSSLRYPTLFSGDERRVEISGEAYFEVAKNQAMPFVVSVNGKQDVKVLGTHFNINSYEEEGSEKVTLLEGSVKVADGNYSVILKPGQQSLLTENGFEVEEADVEQVIAWKTGFFEFTNSSLQEIMRGLGRWYDVDVVYENNSISPTIFGGRISKHLPLSKVLKMLEVYGVQARIKGKEIIITEGALETYDR